MEDNWFIQDNVSIYFVKKTFYENVYIDNYFKNKFIQVLLFNCIN